MSKRYRVYPLWSPTWTKQIEKWTVGKLWENKWRFDPIEEMDDLLQESRILFFVLGKKYPIVNQDAHFFALYRTSLFRFMHDKSRVKQNSAIDHNICAEDYATENQLAGDVTNHGLINLLLKELPSELKTVLQVLTSGRRRAKLEKSTVTFHRRENHNMRLRRHADITSADPVGDLKRYFINT